MRRTIFLLIFLVSYPFFLAGSERPEYPCYQLKEEPVLDGRIEEAAWRNIPEATGFFVLASSAYAIEKQTHFQAGWTKEAIYIAVRAEEPELKKMVAKANDGDASIWTEDSIEIFFFPKKADTYFQFMINTVGSRWNGKGVGASQPVQNWQVKTYTGNGFWSLEVKIPFRVLERVPENEERWPANIARNILTGPATERFTSWPPLGMSFHDFGNFGFFVFKEKSLLPEEVKGVEKELDAPYYNYLKGAISKIAQSYQATAAAVKGTKTPKFQPEADSLKEAWGLIEAVSEKKDPNLKELSSAVAKAKSANLLEKSELLRNKILLETVFEEE